MQKRKWRSGVPPLIRILLAAAATVAASTITASVCPLPWRTAPRRHPRFKPEEIDVPVRNGAGSGGAANFDTELSFVVHGAESRYRGEPIDHLAVWGICEAFRRSPDR